MVIFEAPTPFWLKISTTVPTLSTTLDQPSTGRPKIQKFKKSIEKLRLSIKKFEISILKIQIARDSISKQNKRKSTKSQQVNITMANDLLDWLLEKEEYNAELFGMWPDDPFANWSFEWVHVYRRLHHKS